MGFIPECLMMMMVLLLLLVVMMMMMMLEGMPLLRGSNENYAEG